VPSEKCQDGTEKCQDGSGKRRLRRADTVLRRAKRCGGVYLREVGPQLLGSGKCQALRRFEERTLVRPAAGVEPSLKGVTVVYRYTQKAAFRPLPVYRPFYRYTKNVAGSFFDLQSFQRHFLRLPRGFLLLFVPVQTLQTLLDLVQAGLRQHVAAPFVWPFRVGGRVSEGGR
jgi:hypothetical protein